MADELTVIEGNAPEQATPNEPITSFVIDDGTRSFPLFNRYKKEIGVLRFRPADFGIVTRYNQSRDKWDEATRLFEEIDGDDPDSKISDMEKATRAICDVFDFVLGSDVSADIFREVNPFNPVPVSDTESEFFCAVVIDCVQKLIEQEFGEQVERMKRRKERMDKYRPNRQQRRAAK